MAGRPRIAKIENHNRITGPKRAPTFSVPRYWSMNRLARMIMVIGMTYGLKAGVMILNPSMALNTEMAGVIIPSP
jgi:hypothetical protein